MPDELAVVSPEQSLISVIERAANNPEVDVAKMSALLDLQLKIMDRQAEIAFNKDFALASDEMPTVEKNGIIDMGPKGKMFFAKYEDLDAAISPIEKKHGFTRSFRTVAVPIGSEMILHLTHKQGHSITSSRLMPPDKGAGRNAMQAIGSADSYMRRYLTMHLWNIVTIGADDDANSSKLVTEKQLTEIENLLDEIGTHINMDKFLGHFKAKNIGAIQQRDFKEVISMLNQQLRGVKK